MALTQGASQVDVGSLPSQIYSKFVEFEADQANTDFIERVAQRRHGPVKTWLHNGLRRWMSDFDVNGLLKMYPMHLLSTEQWTRLLGRARGELGTLLDVGAGNGDVTQTLAPLFSETTVTEQSRWMRRRLQDRGFTVGSAQLDMHTAQYDVVSCLNVLDRTKRPVSLVSALAERVRPGGQLVLSLPLPSDPFFYRGARTLPPVESLRAGGVSFEDGVKGFLETLGRTDGDLELLSFCRRPYLSGGDAGSALYSLDSGVFRFGKPSDR